tara:strand:+ start:1597 stop:2775 length:1179 start_codon:yes stop_codon:yes gene_type:complete
MNLNTKKEKTVSRYEYPVIDAEEVGNLTISSHLQEQIDVFHSFAGPTEWSGILLYTIDKGDINDPSSLKITAKAMFPMDIGTAAYTEYDYGPEVMDMYDMYPKALEEGWILGHIHTHHNMKAYFSGTDTQELRDNIDNHSNYLSLIVNFKKEYCAKICKKAVRKVENKSLTTFKSFLSDKLSVQKSNKTYEEDIVYAVGLTIEMPLEEDMNKEITFFSRLISLKKTVDNFRSSIRPVGTNTGYSSTEIWNSNSKGVQLDLWNNKETIYDNTPQAVVTFIFRLLRVSSSLDVIADSIDDVHTEITSTCNRYEYMTAADKKSYLEYVELNIPKIVANSLEDNILLLDKVVDLLTEHSSSNYGYNSYESEHMVDEILLMLENYDITTGKIEALSN